MGALIYTQIYNKMSVSLPNPGYVCRFKFSEKLGQMFANLRRLKSEDRSPNPTFPPLQIRPNKGGICPPEAAVSHMSVLSQFETFIPLLLLLLPLGAEASHPFPLTPIFSLNNLPLTPTHTPPQTSLYIYISPVPTTPPENGINCFHKTQHFFWNDRCNSACFSFSLL